MKTTTTDLTAAQALYVLDRMLKEKAVSMRDVRNYLDGLNAEIKALEGRLATLRDAGSAASTAAPAKAPAARKRRGRPSRKAAAAASTAASAPTVKARAKRTRSRKGRKSKSDVAPLGG